MKIRIAINGFGRIGRNILRAMHEGAYKEQIELVAINDLGTPEFNAHLAQFDSVHGRFPGSITLAQDVMSVNGSPIKMLSERDPKALPWKELKIDVVLECTGIFTDSERASAHLAAGAKKVVISAPAKDVDATIVYGVNDHTLRPEHRIISNASCTTNCLAPVAKVLDEAIGIEQGSMTTIHAYTNDQKLHDVYHSDIYRARAAGQSMIPTKTGAAQAVSLVLPQLEGRLDGMAVRVPTANVSLVDLNVILKRETSVDEVNGLMEAAANASLEGVLLYNTLPLVSVDFNHIPASSIFDATQTRVNGRLVKLMAWYDNEWGFSNRMLDNTLALMQLGTPAHASAA